MEDPEGIEITETERCIFDVLNELHVTKAEKFNLLYHYLPVLNLDIIPQMIERIEFVELLKEYAEKRNRGATVKHYYKHIKIRLN